MEKLANILSSKKGWINIIEFILVVVTGVTIAHVANDWFHLLVTTETVSPFMAHCYFWNSVRDLTMVLIACCVGWFVIAKLQEN